MRYLLICLIVLLTAASRFSPGVFAQTATKQVGGKSIPDLSGLWENRFPRRPPQVGLCGEPGCRGVSAVLGFPTPDRPPEDVEAPQMLPWVEQNYKSAREGVDDPNGFAHQEFNPAWSGCMPEGPAEVARLRGFELRQFPDVVLLLYDYDHQVRRIYVDGRRHPDNRVTTWMGHSIGNYEGDTLVVDTIGINEKTWIDGAGHPHTDALHMIERYRRLNQNSLEIQFTFDDPKAYVKPWTKKVTHELRPPGIDLWNSAECEELLRMGTHYSQK